MIWNCRKNCSPFRPLPRPPISIGIEINTVPGSGNVNIVSIGIVDGGLLMMEAVKAVLSASSNNTDSSLVNSFFTNSTPADSV